MYKLILFDLGGVLFTNGTAIFIEKIASRYKIPKENIKDILDGEVGSLYRESKINRNQFWERVIGTLSLSEESDVLEKEWIDSYSLIEKTKEIIEKLRQKYKVYFLSDNVKEREEALDAKYGFKNLFDGGIFSYEVGFRKPDTRIYKFALEKGGEGAKETIFIDDKESSLVPAREMGITAILFETPEKLEKNLQRLGVL